MNLSIPTGTIIFSSSVVENQLLATCLTATCTDRCIDNNKFRSIHRFSRDQVRGYRIVHDKFVRNIGQYFAFTVQDKKLSTSFKVKLNTLQWEMPANKPIYSYWDITTYIAPLNFATLTVMADIL